MTQAIDVHAHLAVPAVDALIDGHPGLARQRQIDAATLGPASLAVNVEQIAALGPRLVDLDTRLAAMDAARVDVQAVSAVPLPHAWAPPDLADRIVAATNEGVAAYCAKEPARLIPIGTVSLQHPSLVVAQLRAAADLGLRGVQISTAAGPDRELDDPSLADFWAAAEELGLAVLIHPWGCTLGERLNAYYLFNSVGNPTETALALSRLLFSGVLERHPGLRIWSAHGGGYLPSYVVRADHAWAARPDARTTAEPPSALLRRTFVDSLVYTPEQLRHLVAVMGSSQVTLGSDYPFDMGVDDPVDRLEAAGFDAATTDAIRGGNAARLLGLAL
ncbi:amidohydrolase family protein [Cryptosporangium aurantiacum]|uniref:Aminocarboxymuconate-semialdehyde decarboxylase n=1 Tax=Cryptosporangium aurantiacum TaxID=134849 RepID=A0A1M7RKQ3_9ACTN|nr:amidohydrolase family protein [Cryptosporangium aurantiacum]SHN46742.1 aminocarboxymuconate-semialdehyde decarboxylase [Cryptosporangium aurantiacum]